MALHEEGALFGGIDEGGGAGVGFLEGLLDEGACGLGRDGVELLGEEDELWTGEGKEVEVGEMLLVEAGVEGALGGEKGDAAEMWKFFKGV